MENSWRPQGVVVPPLLPPAACWLSRPCGSGPGPVAAEASTSACAALTPITSPKGTTPSRPRRHRPGTCGTIAAAGMKADHGFFSALGRRAAGGLTGLVHRCAHSGGPSLGGRLVIPERAGPCQCVLRQPQPLLVLAAHRDRDAGGSKGSAK